MKIYYVYAYLDPRKPGNFKYGDFQFNYEPFYIGKGTKSRMLRHLKDDRNPIKINKINKIKQDGLSPIIIKIIDNISNDDALEIEKLLIKDIGRIVNKTGALTNYTEGGESYIGYKHTSEYIEDLYRPIIKYDFVGQIIEEYKSVKEAGEKNNIIPQTISQICSGKIKLHKSNFIFCYKDDLFKNRERKRKGFSVLRIDYNNEIKQYDTISDAAVDNKTTPTRINAVCVGDRFQSGGFLFRYKDNNLLNKFTNKINSKFGKYLSLIDIEIEYNGEVYKNILHVISSCKNVKINNIYNSLINKKIYKFNEFKSA